LAARLMEKILGRVEKPLNRAVRTLCASVLSQDETPGQANKRKRRR
jgi:hypothetical protein